MSETSSAVAAGLTARETTSLSAAVTRKFDALYVRLRLQNEEKIKRMDNEHSETISRLKNKLTESDNVIKNIEKQLQVANLSLTDSQNRTKTFEKDIENLYEQNASISDEKFNMQTIIEKQKENNENMKRNSTDLTMQLKKAIGDKCEVLSKYDEIQNKASFLEQKESRIEQEKILLNNQIRNLSDDLKKYKMELQTIRTDYKHKIITLESDLSTNIDQLNIANEKIESLTELNSKLIFEKDELSQKIFSQTDLENTILNNYKKELETKTKLNDMFQNMINDFNKKYTEQENQLAQLILIKDDLMNDKEILKTQNSEFKTKYDMLLKENENVISSLKNELESVNKKLSAKKDENIKILLEDLAPSAYTTCNLIKEKSLTQIYEQIFKLSDELNVIKAENNHLKHNTLLDKEEIKEKDEKIQEANLKYDDIIKVKDDIQKQYEELLLVYNKRSESLNRYDIIKLENNNLKNNIKDLSRQVCYLLYQLENKQQTVSDQMDTSADSESISRDLITFKDLEELQKNNLFLIKQVNDLKEKLQVSKDDSELEDAQNINSLLNDRVQNLIETQEQQTKIIEALTLQKNHYEKLYNELQEKYNAEKKLIENSNVSLEKDKADQIKSFSDSIRSEPDSSDQIKSLKNQLNKQKEDFNIYKEEILANENILNDQLSKTRTELNLLTTEYAKSISSAKTTNEMYEMVKNNIDVYKKQIECLEERNKVYDNSIIKQEEVIKYLRDQVMQSLTKLNKNEILLENSKQECKFLKDTNNRLIKERDLLRKERYSQSLIVNDIELLKVSEARKDEEEKMNLENKINILNKENIELQNKLKLQESDFTEMKVSLQRKLSQTENSILEFKSLIEKKKEEINTLNEQIKNKSHLIDDLNKRVLNLITISSKDNAPDVTKKIKDLEMQLHNKQSLIIDLQQQLTVSNESIKEHAEKYNEVCGQYKTIQNSFSEHKSNSESTINQLRLSEQSLKDTINNLRYKLSERFSPTKPKLEITKHVEVSVSPEEKPVIDENPQISDLLQALKTAEDKYAHEMSLHSSDLQKLIELKQNCSQMKNEIELLKSVKNKYENEIMELNNKQNIHEKEVLGKHCEFQLQLNDLRSQNSILHEQLQNYNNINIELNKSRDGNSSLNVSQNESVVSSKNLHQIINSLKKDNDIYVLKLEMIQAEKERIKLELEILEKKLKEMKIAFKNEKKNNESNNKFFIKNSDVQSKLETLNALTDSNVILRQEKGNLQKQVNELSTHLSDLNQSFNEIQEKNKELSSKIDQLTPENTNLKQEISRWRARINALVEKSNKQSPEDWKRLQNERETLAKMLTTEKENAKKCIEELTLLKAEKVKLQENMENINNQHSILNEEYNKQSNQLGTLKDDIDRITQELVDAKTLIAKENEKNTELNATIATQESNLAEITDRELRVRKIAKNYKTQYELLKKLEEKKENNDKSLDDEMKNKIVELENMISQLKEKISSSEEKNNNLNEEIKNLQKNIVELEKLKSDLSDAQSNILNLTQINDTVTTEFDEFKSKIENSEKENDLKFTTLKTKYEEQIVKIKHEKSLLEQSKHNELSKMNRKVEYLLQKISQMQKSINQSSKPSTSSVPDIEIEAPTNIKSTSDISSTPSSSQNITENLPTSSSTGSRKFHDVGLLPPESTQDVESDGVRGSDSEVSDNTISKTIEIIHESTSPHMETISELGHNDQAASSSSNNNNSNSTVTTSHRIGDLESLQRSNKRMRQLSNNDEICNGKRVKIQSITESEQEYQVPTSSQRDQEDDCVIVVDSGDEENQCGNSFQEMSEEMEDEKIAQSVENENKDETPSVRSTETNEVDITDDVSPETQEVNIVQEEEENSANTSEVLPERCSILQLPSRDQQIETISSVTEGSSGNNMYNISINTAGISYDEGNDSIVPSTPVLYMPRRNDGFGEAVSSPAMESVSGGDGCFIFSENNNATESSNIGDTHADLTSLTPHHSNASDEIPSASLGESSDKLLESSEAEAEGDSPQENITDEDGPTVSSQGTLSDSPNQVEETSEAEASTTGSGNILRNGKKGHNNRTSEYDLRQSFQRTQRYGGRPFRRPQGQMKR